MHQLDRPLATSGPGGSDLVPLSSAFHALRRRWWLVVGAAVVPIVVAAIMDVTAPQDVARVRLPTLATEDWPPVDPSRATLASALRDTDVVAATQEAAGADVVLELDPPINEPYVDVVVRARDGEAALAGARAAAPLLADRLYEDPLRGQIAAVRADLASLRRDLDRLDRRVEGLRSSERVTDAEPGSEGAIAIARAASERRVLLSRRSELQQRLTSLEQREPDVTPADPPSVRTWTGRTDTIVAFLTVRDLLSAFVAGLFAAVAVTHTDRRRPVTDPAQVAELFGEPVLGRDPTAWSAAVGVDRPDPPDRRPRSGEPGRLVAVGVGVPGSLAATVVESSGVDPGSRVQPLRPEDAAAAAGSAAAVVVVRHGVDSATAAAAARHLRRAGIDVTGAMLVTADELARATPRAAVPSPAVGP